jgi:hypothetical protein
LGVYVPPVDQGSEPAFVLNVLHADAGLHEHLAHQMGKSAMPVAPKLISRVGLA